jgi:glutamate dehydrogenase
MQKRAEDSRSSVIKKVTEYINKKLPKKQAKLLSAFVPQYFAIAPMDELARRSVGDLSQALLSHWNLIFKRKPGECKIRVYNPELKKDGWESVHTIIEVSHDDMPFLVDSLRMEINRVGFNSHLMVHVGGTRLLRNGAGEVVDILPKDALEGQGLPEAPIYIEIDHQTDPKVLKELEKNLRRVLGDVEKAVADWQKMCLKVHDALAEVETVSSLDPAIVDESKYFLRWLVDSHFTFLGYREYKITGKGETMALGQVSGSSLGILRTSIKENQKRLFSSLPPEARDVALSRDLLVISKTNTKSTVHRPIFTDYIGVKRFNAKGELIGERRFIGLFTSAAYNSNPIDIPFLRHKVTTVIKKSQLQPAGHACKELVNILETLPRDDLFQTSTDELFDLSMGILGLQERQRIRLFTRKDVYGRFVSCLVYVPRDRVNTELRQAMQAILMADMNGIESSFSTQFSESLLARVHYIVRCDTSKPLDYDVKDIEAKLVEAGRTWGEELVGHLRACYDEEKASELIHKYIKAFPAGYRDDFSPLTAVHDIEYIEKLTPEHTLEMNFYRAEDEKAEVLRFKLFQPEHPIPLSDVLPILEHMGLRVLGERPHQIIFANGTSVWINDFGMVHERGSALDVVAARDFFQEAFRKIWNGDVENDGFNRLVLSAQLNIREVTMLRAYTKYLRQTNFTFSQAYVEETLAKNPVIARYLVELFKLRFDPACAGSVAKKIEQVETELQDALNAVVNLDEDRILRRFHELINASLRTNYFQRLENGAEKNYLSFKLDPQKISELPLPKPKFEIFVYSPRFEGVHLRGAKVARGGIRWSDRREDFRTEVLGLMKAQQVKNAVIVPSGAKGGFVPKWLPVDGGRDAIMEEGICCYKNFIRGLLDLTDNLVSGKVVPPANTARYDEDDPYLVVAADKGTATFSDIANAISQEYHFWLDDAFASGGSAGYDHKKMGITARGAWESVKRHLRELSINPETTDFTVVGIGDMSGDVFGNGMLMSRHIKLVGVFNHMHIFLDPNPDAEKSFIERERLFNLPRSTWEDYNPSLISQGGGVFKRSAKSITLTPEIKRLLDLDVNTIVPDDLIRALLKARVDLLWNGGIGTYVKAASERNTEVGDRSNDAIRINGEELRCRAVGEGGNLGFTQLGRVEYSLSNGLIYTDFIDNSAGVDCSDHEVNIKILLNGVVAAGRMSLKQRNQLLAEMTEEVGRLVLRDNYYQTQALNLAALQATENMDLYIRYMDEQTRQGKLERTLEFLPDNKTMLERKVTGKGLTRSELAVLLAYCKINIKHQILDSKLLEEPYLACAVEAEFPVPLRRRYKAEMAKHSLWREIVATQLSNQMVNDMGITFVHRLHDETGAPLSAVVRAYTVAKVVFDMPELMSLLESLDYKIPVDIQCKMMTKVSRLVRRATRWFLRNRRAYLDIESTIEHFTAGVAALYDRLPKLLPSSLSAKFEELRQEYIDAGVPSKLAGRIAISSAMFSVLDIIDTATENELNIDEVATVYFALDEHLGLNWFREQISNHPVTNHWDALARAALRDDIDWQQRGLTIGVLRSSSSDQNYDARIQAWLQKHRPLIERWEQMVTELRAATHLEFLMFSVAVRELLDLTQASLQAVKSGRGGRAGKKKIEA